MSHPAPADAVRHELLYGDRLVPCYAERPANLDDLLGHAVQARAGEDAIEDGERRWTYAAFDREVGRVADALAASGIAAGDRVVLFVGNRAEFVFLLFGIWRAGGVAVPIGIRQSAAELGHLLNHCGAAALFFDAALASRVPAAEATPVLKLAVHIDEPGSEATAAAERSTSFTAWLSCEVPAAAHSTVDEQSPACIMYTSGTTGNPKGAVLSHLGFFHTARHYHRRFGYRPSDRNLLVIPGSHISGLLAVIVVTVAVGACLIVQREFQAARVLETIAARRVTATVMVPAMYNLCLLEPRFADHDLGGWRIGHFGGAAMPEVTIQRLAEQLPGLALHNGFGATETTSAVSLTTADATARHPDTVGTLLPCVDVRVLDARGAEVAAGDSGELWIRSPGNAIGYWNDPQASKAAFVAGYWRSGDIGSLDAQGFLRVHDRIKDMINRGGYKVYCVELENLIQRFPGVVEAAVVRRPCRVLGERIQVFVHAETSIDTASLKDFCRASLADYKTPDVVSVSAVPLPRNLNGKLVKAPLREIARREAEALRSSQEL